MKTIAIEELQDRAVHCYVAGLYDQARQAWEEILSVESTDARAAEGLRMLELLARRDAGATGAAPDVATLPAAGLGQAVEEIEDLARSSRYKEAVDAADSLCAAHPASVAAHELQSRVRRKFESAPFIAGELDRARRARTESDLAEVRAACRRILAVDPENRLAERLMEDPQGDWFEALSECPAAEPPCAAPIASGELTLAPGSSAESLFEMPSGADDQVFDLDLPCEGEAEEKPAHTRAPDPHHGGEASIDEPLAGFEEEAAPKNKFSELENEIDETLGLLLGGTSVAAADVDGTTTADADRAPATFPGEGTGPEPVEAAASPESPAGEDLTFDEGAAPPAGDDGLVWAAGETPETTQARFEAVAKAVEQALDPRIAAYVLEAQGLLGAGRYSEAIETASRAFAIDSEAPGAQDLIDNARAHLDEIDRQSEEHIYHAQKFLEEGDDSAAEALLREVLRSHPGHREALDFLDRISRQKGDPARSEDTPEAVPDLVYTAHEPSAAATVAILRPVPEQPAEPFVPRPYKPEAFDEDDPEPSPSSAEVIEPKQPRRSALGQIVWGVLVVGLLALLAFGLVQLPRLFIETGDESRSPAPAAVDSEKTHDATRKPRQTSAPVADAPPQPAVRIDPLPAIPRTFEQAKALAGEGKLAESRQVLKDLLEHEPSNRQAAELLVTVQERLQASEQLDQAMAAIETAFKQDRFEDALRMLYRLPQPMQRGDVERYKRNAWFNNALSYMLGGNLTESIRCFKEALEIDPADADAKHLTEYLRNYQGRDKDRSYFNYVESLPKRSIDAP